MADIKMTVNVLGAEYTLEIVKPGIDEKLKYCDGYADWTTRRIAVLDPQTDENSVGDIEAYKRKVMRHEITHAFMFESGLLANTNQGDVGGAYDEQVVDWIAYQGPKIYAAWQSVGAV